MTSGNQLLLLLKLHLQLLATSYSQPHNYVLCYITGETLGWIQLISYPSFPDTAAQCTDKRQTHQQWQREKIMLTYSTIYQ